MEDKIKESSYQAHKEIMDILSHHEFSLKAGMCVLLASIMGIIKENAESPKLAFLECSNVFINEADKFEN